MKKIFDQIEREKNENEYNRTEIHDRTIGLSEALHKFQFDLNTSQDVRVVDNYETLSHNESYANQQRALNKKRMLSSMNGFTEPGQLVYLQVKGKNQLYKEIEETQFLDNKYLDMKAIHRNEITHEIEGMENSDIQVSKDTTPKGGKTGKNKQRSSTFLPDSNTKIEEVIAMNYDAKELFY